jgi:PP-loop superfamily ATP-utilizing enzyme
MMPADAMDPRLHRAHEVLRNAGLRGARVAAAGHEKEIAAISAPADELDGLLAGDADSVIQELRKLGFRYVAVDLAPVA